MSTAGNTGDDAQPDEERRERSAEERNIVAPTPQDVRAKAEDDEAEENSERPEPPAAGAQAP
ncbi:hypothetical protein OG520_43315 (plasmid) [Streptomyces sp. NBC_00984]|uniref:hypothetical protein n=1 Tax=Streptomyces sp. NBC_00984 TaxID=2903700 RepID=UPI002F90CBF4|nr:hypothetical protein OG520_43315 [Streptomyces sp. NBC_00984]